MNPISATLSTSISNLKKNPSAIIADADGMPVVVLNHNKPAAYLVPAETWERLMDALEDQQLAELIHQRRQHMDSAITVELDAL